MLAGVAALGGAAAAGKGSKDPHQAERGWYEDYKKELAQLAQKPLAKDLSGALDILREWDGLAQGVDGKEGGSLEKDDPELSAKFVALLKDILAGRQAFARRQTDVLSPAIDAHFFLAKHLAGRKKVPSELAERLQKTAAQASVGLKPEGGDCVFSSQPFRKGLQASLHFTRGSQVFVRCYLDEPAQAYAGARYANRGDGRFVARFRNVGDDDSSVQEIPLGTLIDNRGKKTFDFDTEAMGDGNYGMTTLDVAYLYIDGINESSGKPVWGGYSITSGWFSWEESQKPGG